MPTRTPLLLNMLPLTRNLLASGTPRRLPSEDGNSERNREPRTHLNSRRVALDSSNRPVRYHPPTPQNGKPAPTGFPESRRGSAVGVPRAFGMVSLLGAAVAGQAINRNRGPQAEFQFSIVEPQTAHSRSYAAAVIVVF